MTDYDLKLEAPAPVAPTLEKIATIDELNDLRRRQLAGEELTEDEYRYFIRSYRAIRRGVVDTAAPKIERKAAAAKTSTAVPLETILAGLAKKLEEKKQ